MSLAISYSRPLKHSSNPVALTRRELEVLKLICMGKSMNEVAKQIHISGSTVISHKRNLFKKFQVNSLVRLGVMAERLGYL